jgi:hypothetical protein
LTREPEIFPDRLQILNYYFPTTQSRVIKFSSIKSIRTTKELNLGVLGYKGWGMFWEREEERRRRG